MKTCTRCGQQKHDHSFSIHRGKNVRHGKKPVLQSWCRECTKEHKRTYMSRLRAERRRQDST